MKKLRTKRIEIAVTEDEYQQLLERKTKPRLAEWMREVALEQKSKRTVKPTDPNLLFLLNRIGTNINQIAKQCNTLKGSVDLVNVAIRLKEIEDKLDEIINHDC